MAGRLVSGPRPNIKNFSVKNTNFKYKMKLTLLPYITIDKLFGRQVKNKFQVMRGQFVFGPGTKRRSTLINSDEITTRIQKKFAEDFEKKYLLKIEDSLANFQDSTDRLQHDAKSAFYEGGPAFRRYAENVDNGQSFYDAVSADPLKKRIVQYYVKAWGRTYELYKSIHKARTPEKKYSQFPFVKYKRANIGRKSLYNKKVLKYRGHSLATGFLRGSISNAFEHRLGKYSFLTPGNLFLSGAFEFDRRLIRESEGSKYYKLIISTSNMLEKIGTYSGVKGNAKEIVNFYKNDWQKIADLMVSAWKYGPIRDIQKLTEAIDFDLTMEV